MSAKAVTDIRWLTPDDAAAFQALRLHALQESPTAFGSSYEEEKDQPLTAVQQRLVLQADRGVLGAWADGALIGTLGVLRRTALKQRHHMMIWGIYVSPSQRGQGLAQRLLADALAFARQCQGVQQVHLGVNTGNASALRIYQAAGFSIYGTEPGALCVDGQLHDEHFMLLRL
ncbi:MAG: GNAT family N-acetyltransferase [Comamonas sp.]